MTEARTAGPSMRPAPDPVAGPGKRLVLPAPRGGRAHPRPHRHRAPRHRDRRHPPRRPRDRDEPPADLLHPPADIRDGVLRPARGRPSANGRARRPIGTWRCPTRPAPRRLELPRPDARLPHPQGPRRLLRRAVRPLHGGRRAVTPQPGGFYGGWITSGFAGPSRACRGAWAGERRPLSPSLFAKDDPSDDALFYRPAALVTHIDDRAIAALTARYAEAIPPGSRVLDLLSSWVSHLPPTSPCPRSWATA
jgi:hypothetical protein